MVSAVLWGLTRRQLLPAGAAATVTVLLVGIAGLRAPPGAGEGLQYERDTVYHRITVSDEGGVRFLKLDNYWQSALDLSNPRRTVFAYTDYMHLPVILRPDARRVLMIGLGGATVPARYYQDYPQMHLDVAELDPRVVEVARRFPTVSVFPVDWDRFGSPVALRNIMLVATDQPPQPRDAVLRAAARARTNPGVTLPQVEESARDLYPDPIGTRDVPVLTDDFAPVETLLQWR